MADFTPPQELVNRLKKHAETITELDLNHDVLEAADTIKYLLKLLGECASYIEDHKEYDAPPRFIKAVREILPR